MSYEIVLGAAICFATIKGWTYFTDKSGFSNVSTIKEGAKAVYATLYSIVHAKQTEDRVSELESIVTALKADMAKIGVQVPSTQGSYVKLNNLQSNLTLIRQNNPETSFY